MLKFYPETDAAKHLIEIFYMARTIRYAGAQHAKEVALLISVDKELQNIVAMRSSHVELTIFEAVRLSDILDAIVSDLAVADEHWANRKQIMALAVFHHVLKKTLKNLMFVTPGA